MYNIDLIKIFVFFLFLFFNVSYVIYITIDCRFIYRLMLRYRVYFYPKQILSQAHGIKSWASKY